MKVYLVIFSFIFLSNSVLSQNNLKKTASFNFGVGYITNGASFGAGGQYFFTNYNLSLALNYSFFNRNEFDVTYNQNIFELGLNYPFFIRKAKINLLFTGGGILGFEKYKEFIPIQSSNFLYGAYLGGEIEKKIRYSRFAPFFFYRHYFMLNNLNHFDFQMGLGLRVYIHN